MNVLAYLPYAVSFWIFAMGCYGLVRCRNLIAAVLALAVAQSSTYVLLLSIGFHKQAGAPIFSPTNPVGSPAVDPIVQALTLTDIVVGATVSALILALSIQIHRRTSCIDPERLSPMSE